MTAELTPRIAALTDAQALEACGVLTTAIETELPPGQVDTTDLNQLVESSGDRVGGLVEELRDARLTPEEAAQGARSLLQLAADLGYGAQVEIALEAVGEHHRDFGVVSGPVLLAALAVVLAYVPVEQRQKATRVRRVNADGSTEEEEVTESETKRVGATAVEKLAAWWKATLPTADR